MVGNIMFLSEVFQVDLLISKVYLLKVKHQFFPKTFHAASNQGEPEKHYTYLGTYRESKPKRESTFRLSPLNTEVPT